MNTIDKLDYYGLTDEEIFAIKSGKGINDDIFKLYSDKEIEEKFHFEMYAIVEMGIGFNKYLVERCEKALKDLKSLDKKTIKNLSRGSIKNIIELLDRHKVWLEEEINEEWDKYELLDNELKTKYGHVDLR